MRLSNIFYEYVDSAVSFFCVWLMSHWSQSCYKLFRFYLGIKLSTRFCVGQIKLSLSSFGISHNTCWMCSFLLFYCSSSSIQHIMAEPFWHCRFWLKLLYFNENANRNNLNEIFCRRFMFQLAKHSLLICSFGKHNDFEYTYMNNEWYVTENMFSLYSSYFSICVHAFINCKKKSGCNCR